MDLSYKFICRDKLSASLINCQLLSFVLIGVIFKIRYARCRTSLDYIWIEPGHCLANVDCRLAVDLLIIVQLSNNQVFWLTDTLNLKLVHGSITSSFINGGMTFLMSDVWCVMCVSYSSAREQVNLYYLIIGSLSRTKGLDIFTFWPCHKIGYMF